MSNNLRVLTSSSTRCFRTCARKYRHRYIDCAKPLQQAPALWLGSMVHRGLEEMWRAKKEGANASVAVERAVGALVSADVTYEIARAEAMLLGYVARWYEQDLEVLEVEVEYEQELRNPRTNHQSRTWAHKGKIDAIARINGDVWVIEHKTSGEDIGAGSAYWRRLRLDDQVSNYLRGARALGYDPVGCVYDVLRKPRQRPKLATPVEKRKYTAGGLLYKGQHDSDEDPALFRARLCEAIAADPDYYYRRGNVVRLEGEADEAEADLWMTGKMIRESELANSWPRNPSACMTYNRECDYFAVCTGEASIDDPRYTQGRAHEELSVLK